MSVLHVMPTKTKDFKVLLVFAILGTSLPLIPKGISSVTSVPHNVITVNIMRIHALFVTLQKIKLQDMTAQVD